MADLLSPTPARDRLRYLIDKLMDESASPAEQLELETQLRENPAACDLYLLYTDMHAYMHWLTMGEPTSRAAGHHKSEALDPLADLRPLFDEVSVSRPTLEPAFTRAKMGWFVAATIMVACIAFLMAVLTTPRPPVQRPGETSADGPSVAANTSDALNKLAADGVVAAIETCDSARWRPGAERTAGTVLRKGDACELISGRAMVRFARGAQVVLEGPATFAFQDADSGFLRRGRLAANVPPTAIGFAVDAPMARIIDLGTEFGVDVDDRGNVEVEVFTGQVDVTATGTKSESKPSSVRLSAGQASRIESGELRPTAATNSQKFASVRRNLPSLEQDIDLVLDDVKVGWDDPLCWSDNQTPHLRGHYHVGRTKAKRVRTPGAVPEHLFLGGLLTIHNTGELLFKDSERAKKLVSLRLDGGRISLFGSRGKQVMEILAPLQIVAPSRLDFRTDSIARWGRDFSGEGPLHVSGAGELWLAADCTRYSGDLTIDGTTLVVTRSESIGSGRIAVVGGGKFETRCDLEQSSLTLSFDRKSALVLNHRLVVGTVEIAGKRVGIGEYSPGELREQFGANVEGTEGRLIVIDESAAATAPKSRLNAQVLTSH